MTDSVSVLIPCYNGMPYLPKALDSALAQTHRPAQIIVVDDGSSDNSARIVQDYAQRYPDRGILLIQQPNAGEPAARNAGIAAAETQWVANLDTDDWWEPNKLERQIAAAKEAGPDCVMVHTGWIYHQPDGSTLNSDLAKTGRRVGRCTEALLESSSIGHPSIMIRRESLTEIGGYDDSFRQACDIDLYFRLSAIGGFAFVPEYLLHYRRHENQMSADQADQISYHHRAVRRFFEKHPQIAEQIGPDRIESALNEHVSIKLESLWWRRNLRDFRRLLAYAREQRFDSEPIRAWRRRAMWPNWLINLKDRLVASGTSRGGAAQ